MQLQPIDSMYQLQALRFVLSHLFYGQDELVRQMLSAPLQGDSTPVLFEDLLPQWEESQRIEDQQAMEDIERFMREQSMPVIQRTTLTLLVEKQLPGLARQNQSGILVAVCNELAVFERRLSALEGLSPAKRQRVEELASVLATAFGPSPAPCAKSP